MNVIWRKNALNELEAIYKYIKKESPQNAVLVFNSIYDLAISLPNFPYKFPVEPIINIEKVRFVVVWSFKIVYSVEKDSIVILRVFNTKQNPKKLKK
ncbi:type II toxin-antitoxin system RelE/ParE family toxin [Flavobacterium cellulosilyticum]|uniref:Type II toxin-antitoxin system RelE/ParE family toxin n=1 Tax=Flavobacterium cellulosilyticum TaxID=2541731 RepID=A0A4R5CD53_9FLAO|nr:type II toxin-antitoxin system RelE/ParE family toxin [Flavobacterium cellulosilyticum]TDD97405.1 type II toxin-antitoxin system RelE/ParE family toxin [Flavobacterium cellulosilyticum]